MSTYDFLRSLILPLREIDNFLPKEGKIIDLGCGEGVIARYLAKAKTRKVVGIDNDKKRLQQSAKENLEFIFSDIRNYVLKDIDGVVISDVLHHLNFNDQKKIFSNIYRGFNKNGVLVIKEIDSEEFIRSKLSRFWDYILYPKDRIHYWNSNELRNSLVALGFKVKIIRTNRFFPGSTTLFICKK